MYKKVILCRKRGVSAMKKIYSSIDIGTYSIKFVVGEYFNNKFYVLASHTVKSKGIKKGLIDNFEDTVYSIKKVLKKAEDLLGLKIRKVVASVPEYNLKYHLLCLLIYLI